MCTYVTVPTAVDGSAKGPDGSWFRVTDGDRLLRPPGARDGRAHAEHRLRRSRARARARASPSSSPRPRRASWSPRSRPRSPRRAPAELEPERRLGSGSMRAVYAESINPDDPLTGLVVGERPDPSRPRAGRASRSRPRA